MASVSQLIVYSNSVVLVMAICQASQWIHINGVPFIRISIFFDSQAGIRSLTNVVENSRTIVRIYHRCLDFLSGHFSVTLICVLGLSYMTKPENILAQWGVLIHR